MKRKINIVVILSGLIFLLNACQKNIDIFVPADGQINGADTNWVDIINDSMQVAALKNNLLLQPQPDSTEVDAISSTTVLSPSGLKCIFPANSIIYLSSNRPVAGKIFIETLLLKTRGDMIRMGKPTVSDGKLLISGGALFISLKKKDSVINIAPQANITLSYTAAITIQGSKLFYGQEGGQGKFNWIINNSSSLSGYVLTNQQGYEIRSSHTGWVSPAQLYDSIGPKTIVVAGLPPQFTNANTGVYLVFKNMLSVADMNGNAIDKKFRSIAVPVGNAVTVVVISKQGGDYYLGYKDVITGTPVSGSTSQLVPVIPIKVSLAAIKNYLDLL